MTILSQYQNLNRNTNTEITNQQRDENLGPCAYTIENSLCSSFQQSPQETLTGKGKNTIIWRLVSRREPWNFFTYSICFFSIFSFLSYPAWKDDSPPFIPPAIQQTISLTFLARGNLLKSCPQDQQLCAPSGSHIIWSEGVWINSSGAAWAPTPQLFVVSDPRCQARFSASSYLCLLATPEAVGYMHESLLKDAGEHGVSIQQDLRGDAKRSAMGKLYSSKMLFSH